MVKNKVSPGQIVEVALEFGAGILLTFIEVVAEELQNPLLAVTLTV
jgi:hypothetical protein